MLPVLTVKYEEFLTIANNLLCYDDIEDCEDLIVEDDDNSSVLMSNQEEKKCMFELQHYFMQEGNEGSPTSALNICADFLEVKCHKNKRETTLDSFFALK
ncbi:hypothetical protein RF11_15501 [Thelohanellus kitauei]|uniref:Uncharacterized protein n=1 Tax=Thelohanellus kitauei TaxID=669202 RepID=A0A0C2MA94_THEKT|nr:hypothetical protein RF11_15501 [Thelohanellus kitauei]